MNKIKEFDITEQEYLALSKDTSITISLDGDLSVFDSVLFVCEAKDVCIGSKFRIIAQEGMNDDVLLSEIKLINPFFGKYSKN